MEGNRDRECGERGEDVEGDREGLMESVMKER